MIVINGIEMDDGVDEPNERDEDFDDESLDKPGAQTPCVQRDVRPLAVIEVKFRDNWVAIKEITGNEAGPRWSMVLSEPIKQVRVIFPR